MFLGQFMDNVSFPLALNNNKYIILSPTPFKLLPLNHFFCFWMDLQITRCMINKFPYKLFAYLNCFCTLEQFCAHLHTKTNVPNCFSLCYPYRDLVLTFPSFPWVLWALRWGGWMTVRWSAQIAACSGPCCRVPAQACAHPFRPTWEHGRQT